MRHLRLLLVFSFEVSGIALLGFVAHSKLGYSGNVVGGLIAFLLLGAFAKFLWVFGRRK